jgi:hypothetical protein
MILISAVNNSISITGVDADRSIDPHPEYETY